MSLEFDNLIEEIKSLYKETDNDLGWSFLVSSKNNLKSNSSIALITLNPGGREFAEPVESFETGNVYCDEDWNGKGFGEESLQKQIQYLFSNLLPYYENYSDYKELMDNSLMGYFIPYRSPEIKELKDKTIITNKSIELWKEIINEVELSLIICIGNDTHSNINKVLRELEYGISETKKLETGWGNVTASVEKYKKETKNLTLLRLPHLSRFKIFNRTGYEEHINKIIKEATK